MTLLDLSVILHGDDPRMELLYFWAAVLLALTPMIIFGGLGVWVARKMWKERHESREPGAGSGD